MAYCDFYHTIYTMLSILSQHANYWLLNCHPHNIYVTRLYAYQSSNVVTFDSVPRWAAHDSINYAFYRIYDMSPINVLLAYFN